MSDALKRVYGIDLGTTYSAIAYVDEHGKPVFSDIPTKTRISLRVEQKAVVQYSCDGQQFAISVRDATTQSTSATTATIPSTNESPANRLLSKYSPSGVGTVCKRSLIFL